MKQIFVGGLVQGVFYRHSARIKAKELNLVGWVKNLDDGQVELCAKGEKVSELIEWCKRGPSGARVESVNVDEIADEELTGFEIR